MRISDWSSDVCSSDLLGGMADDGPQVRLVLQQLQQVRQMPGPDQAVEGEVERHQVAERRLQLGAEHPRGVGNVVDHRANALEPGRSEEHTYELQSLQRISDDAFGSKNKKYKNDAIERGQTTHTAQ